MGKKMTAVEAIGHSYSAQKAGPPKLAHIRIEPADGGGHVVEHHFENYVHEPKRYVFGAGEGQELLDHIEEAAKVKVGKKD